MKTIEGYDVKIFTENIEDNAIEQIRQLLSIGVYLVIVKFALCRMFMPEQDV